MHRFIPFQPTGASAARLYTCEQEFHRHCVQQVEQANVTQLLSWLRGDPHFCYLVAWLDPATVPYTFPPNLRHLMSFRELGAAAGRSKLLASIASVWTGRALHRAILDRLAWFVTQCTRLLYEKYHRSYWKYVHARQLIARGLPFYVSDHLLTTYSMRVMKKSGKVVLHWKDGCWYLDTLLKQKKIGVPYEVAYIMDVLEDVGVITDVAKLCVSYWLFSYSYNVAARGEEFVTWSIAQERRAGLIQ